MLVWLLLFGLCVFLMLNKWFKDARTHKLPPLCSQSLPVIGVTHLVLAKNKQLWHHVKEVSKDCLKQGGVTYGRIGAQLYYLVSDPEDSLTISNACSLNRHFTFNFAKCWLGDGLLTASGVIWHNRRKQLNPSFSLPVIHGFLGIFNDQAKLLVQDMAEHLGKGYFDTAPYVDSRILRMSCMSSFGTSNDDDTFMDKYTKAVDKLLIRLTNRFQNALLHSNLIYTLLGYKKEEDEIIQAMHKMADKVLQKKKAAMKNNFVYGNGYDQDNLEITYKPLVNQLIQLGSLTDTEIRNELNTVIAAGYDTTAHTLKMILTYLGSYQAVQEKVYNELIQVLGPERDIEKEDLPKIIYTEAVIKETLRLLPTVPISPKSIDHDVKLKNYTARAGSQCFVLTYGVHRHCIWGADSEEFRPERWLDENIRGSISAFASFSFGKRGCIGKTYAMISLKVILAHILRTYKIEADHTKMQLIYHVTICPYKGHEISIQRRKNDEQRIK